jgi:uncharacterized RDD family membrane protein YckC
VEEIVTGEAVVIDLPCARFPTRLLARLIDMVLQVILLIAIVLLGVVGLNGGELNTASFRAVLVTAIVVSIVGYPVIFETLTRGRTIGKMALGLRVVADDGGPIRFRHALVRALAGVVECWGLGGVPALVTSMLSARGKRLGDIFAGTFVLRERVPRAAGAFAPSAFAPGRAGGNGPYLAGDSRVAGVPIDPLLRPWAAALDLSALPDGLAASAGSFLSRYQKLDPGARDHLGLQLASGIAACVPPPPPPGVPPVVFLHTVLAERRNRELARMWNAQYAAVQQQAAAPPPAAPPPAPPAPRPAAPPEPAPEPVQPADAGGFTPPA